MTTLKTLRDLLTDCAWRSASLQTWYRRRRMLDISLGTRVRSQSLKLLHNAYLTRSLVFSVRLQLPKSTTMHPRMHMPLPCERTRMSRPSLRALPKVAKRARCGRAGTHGRSFWTVNGQSPIKSGYPSHCAPWRRRSGEARHSPTTCAGLSVILRCVDAEDGRVPGNDSGGWRRGRREPICIRDCVKKGLPGF